MLHILIVHDLSVGWFVTIA